MRQRIWLISLNALAIVIVLGRIGWALYGSEGFWVGIFKLYPPFGAEQIGADVESVVEDFVVFLAIRDDFWRLRSTLGRRREAPEPGRPESDS